MKNQLPSEDGKLVKTADVNIVACAATVVRLSEIKKAMPDAVPTLTAIEQAIDYMRHSLSHGLDRDILIRARPSEGVISVTSTIKLDRPDGAIQ